MVVRRSKARSRNSFRRPDLGALIIWGVGRVVCSLGITGLQVFVSLDEPLGIQLPVPAKNASPTHVTGGNLPGCTQFAEDINRYQYHNDMRGTSMTESCKFDIVSI